ncbi:MAG: hypothetical protein WDW36_003645 [Sanguina aurantia]
MCDPLVGVGLSTAICPRLCDEWFHQCQNDYFLFKHENRTWLNWAPCTKELVDANIGCQLLKKSVPDGEELCRETGHHTSSEDPSGRQCYSGTMTHRSVCSLRNIDENAGHSWQEHVYTTVIVIAAPVLCAVSFVGLWVISNRLSATPLYKRLLGGRKRD